MQTSCCPFGAGLMYELASITAGSFPSSREANAAQKLLESSVGLQRIEGRSQQNGRVESRFITLVQPDHRLVPIAQSNIDRAMLASAEGFWWPPSPWLF